MPSIAFARFWQVDLTRECMLDYLDEPDLRSLRLVSQDFAATLAPILFKDMTIKFNATCFTRQARMAALSRIGYHVRTLTFSMPHSEETFLPPLLDADTLDEITFNYEPQATLTRSPSSSNTSGPKYGSWEINDLLVRQYPLLFHAATNVESFTRAMAALPLLRHLRISCPDKVQVRRRDIVDYALISLRIATEQANPQRLEKLSLDQIRPSSLYYLRPQTGIGTSPASTRVWRRIQTVSMVMDSPSCNNQYPNTSSEHLKILHTYLAGFTSLNHLSFTWAGHKGPSPLSLHTEPCTTGPSSLDYSSTAPNVPSSSSPPSLSSSPSSTRSSASSYFEPFAPRKVVTTPSLRPLKIRRLKSMHLRNASLDAHQASSFIHTHRKTLTEFQFESCDLRSGTWDDALAPLTKMSGNDSWKSQQPHVTALRAPPSTPRSTAMSNQEQTTPRSRTSTLPPLSIPVLPQACNEIFEVPLILSECENEGAEDLQLAVRDHLWLPDDTLSAFHEDDYDYMSQLNIEPGTRRRGVMALKKIGRKIRFATTTTVASKHQHPEKVEEEFETATDGVRRLLMQGVSSGRYTW